MDVWQISSRDSPFKIGKLLPWYTWFEPSGYVIRLSHYFSCGGRSQDLWLFDGHWETAERLSLPFTEHSSSLCLRKPYAQYITSLHEKQDCHKRCVSLMVWAEGTRSSGASVTGVPLFLPFFSLTLFFLVLQILFNKTFFFFLREKNLHVSLAHCVTPLIWQCTC